MSDTKHQELADAGQLHPDGSRIEVCPACLRPLAAGEHMPTFAVAEPDAASVGVATEEG